MKKINSEYILIFLSNKKRYKYIKKFVLPNL